jgi:two-component system sensor histidine kinase MtrB
MRNVAVDAVRTAVRPARSLWRGSLTLRVVSTTLLLSLVFVGLVGALMLNRITTGLLDAKERSSLGEATAGLNESVQALASADSTTTPAQRVDSVILNLAQRAGNPGLYDVLLLATPPKPGDAPERGTHLVAESSVPAALRTAVQRSGSQVWTYHVINYLDGRTVPGLIVGSRINVAPLGPYELYYLFPLTNEQDTLDLVRRTVLGVGALLVLTLGLIAYVVTRQVVSPVRMAAQTAARLSAGHLTERMKVKGEDDLAKLATSFNDMAASMQEQIGRLESLSRVQQRFVSDVSHELRTPLTTIRMAADVLFEARQEFDGATGRSAELLQTQLDRFEALLSDLLEISRFDAGAAVLDVEQVDLRVLTSAAVESTLPLAEHRGGGIELVLPPYPVVVEADARRIDRVLRNLIVNAVEHGEGGPVTVTVALDRLGGGAAVGVRDYGVGLRPGESSLVFNRFWRADPARARSTGGTGLGLAISLEDARLHGGWLQAWGAPGAGAHFRLTLPCRQGRPLAGSPIPLEPTDTVALSARRLAPYAHSRAESTYRPNGSSPSEPVSGAAAGTGGRS